MEETLVHMFSTTDYGCPVRKSRPSVYYRLKDLRIRNRATAQVSKDRKKQRIVDLKNEKSRLEIRDTALATKCDKIIAERNTIRASYQAMAEQKADFEEAIAKYRAAVFQPQL